MIVKDDGLWRGLTRLTQILQPLAIAANAVQGAFIWLDMVLLTFAHLHFQYLQMLTAPTVGVADSTGIRAIISSIKKRWKKADQKAFVACLLINPQYGLGFFDSTCELFRVANISAFLSYMYNHLFTTDSPPNDF